MFHTIARYDWVFGDGATATTTVPTVTHDYQPGTYTARVTLTSFGGTSVSPDVYTGQTMSRNADPRATTTVTVAVTGLAATGCDTAGTVGAGLLVLLLGGPVAFAHPRRPRRSGRRAG